MADNNTAPATSASSNETPISNYHKALNFSIQRTRQLQNMLKQVNDVTYIYPTISVLTISTLNIFVLFFTKATLLIKILALFLLIFFIVFTVISFKK